MKITSFHGFINSIGDECLKSDFIRSLSKDDRKEMVASYEDWRLVFYDDHDLELSKSKPERQVDASDKSFDLEFVEQRYKDFKESFPEFKTIHAMREKQNKEALDELDGEVQPTKERVKSIDEMREKNGVSIAVNVK